MKEVIFLHIGGFFFEIRFLPADSLYFKKLLIKQIVSIYQPFIVNNTKKIDYRIVVMEQIHKIVRVRKKAYEEFLTTYLKHNNNNTVVTYYYISASMFVHILNHIVAELLLKCDGFVLHASASNDHDNALIFAGPSGQGKSTMINLIKKSYPALADDRMIIRKEHDEYRLFQASYFSKNTWIKRRSDSYPIKAIYFLKKAQYTKIEKICDKKEVISLLSKQLLSDQKFLAHNLKKVIEFVNAFDSYYYLYSKKNKAEIIRLMEQHERLK